jgi:D-methionine transport system permease protein
MAGVVGAGGLGDLAIRYGYDEFQTNVVIAVVAVLIVVVWILQFGGDRLAAFFNRR